MKVGQNTDKKQIKFTVAYDGIFPYKAFIFNEQKDLSEDRTIGLAVFKTPLPPEAILVFDRGVASRATFCELENKSIQFVTRITPSAVHQILNSLDIPKEEKNQTVKIIGDDIVKLRDKQSKFTQTSFRLIKAKILRTEEPIWFLTNVLDVSSYEIADIYKKRWDIEVLFKFMKQELNLEHLIVRNENGVKVVFYMTMITALLILAYKKTNKLKGYKLTIMRFAQEIEEELIRSIVILSGGNPDLIKTHNSS